MRKKLLLSLVLFASLHSFAQNVGIGTTTPDASAQLDISSTTKGILIPRMTSAQRTAIASPVRGLMVFDISTNSFWFFNGSIWMETLHSNIGWRLNGNSGTDTAVNFLGTTDNMPLLLKINNIRSGLITGDATYNTAIGFRSLQNLTSGLYNNAFGAFALSGNTTGSDNIAMGFPDGFINQGSYNHGRSILPCMEQPGRSIRAFF